MFAKIETNYFKNVFKMIRGQLLCIYTNCTALNEAHECLKQPDKDSKRAVAVMSEL